MANEIRIKAILDDKISGNLDKIHDKFSTVGNSKGFKSVAQGAGIGVGISSWNLLGSAISSTVGFVGDSIQKASDLNETINKSQVVFGPAADQVKRFGETAATSMGLSENAAISAAATFGNLFVSLGLAPEKVAPMSEAMVKLAGDLASFNNIPVDEALQKLQSGIVGQERPLRELGVAISAASVDTEALALGFQKVNGTFTEGQKVQARYSLIFKQTGTAQGDFARTSGEVANQQRILQAELDDTQAKLGNEFIPIVRDAEKALISFFDEIGGHTGQQSTIASSINDQIKNIDINGLQQSAAAIKAAIDQLNGPLDITRSFNAADINALDTQLKTVQDAITQLSLHGSDDIEHFRNHFDDFASHTYDDIERVRGAIDTVTPAVAIDFRKMEFSAKDWAQTMGIVATDAGNAMVNDFFDPITTRADVYAAHQETLAAEDARRRAKTKSDIKTASNDIYAALEHQSKGLFALGAQGKLTAGDVKTFKDDVTAAYKAMGLKIPPALQKIIDQLDTIQGYDGQNVGFDVNVNFKATGSGIKRPKGGKVNAAGAVGMTAGVMAAPGGGIMGEAGGEAYAILAHPRALRAGDLGGGQHMAPMTVNFNSVWPPTPQQAREIARVIDEVNYRPLRRAAATAGRV